MDSDELKRVLDLCRDRGVRAISWGDAHIEFYPEARAGVPAMIDDGDDEPREDEQFWAAGGTIPKSLKERRNIP